MPPRRKSARKSGIAASTESPPPITYAPAPEQASAATRQPRVTPRNSLAEDATASPPKETPYSTLRQLANIIPRPTTPIRRASSAGPPSTHRTARRIPGQNVTPGGATGPGSTRRPTAATPHGRAAMREIEQRRAAALTPGKDRRRSGRQQRETPRDVLRQLSKVLAPGTKPVEVTPVNQQADDARGPLTRLNDVDEEPMPPRPRLSIALGDEEDDTLLLPPHSDALLDDDNMTMHSVELPRRAVSEQPGGRLSRGSFVSIRTSDRFDQTMQELGMDVFGSERFDPSFVQGGFDDDDGESMLHDEPSILSERTATVDLRNAFLGEELRRVSTASGRPSDVHRLLPDDENDTTFAFQVPQRDGQAASAQAKNSHTARSGLGVVREDEEDEEGEEEEEEVDEMEEPEEAKEHKELEEEMEAELEEGDEGSDPDQIDHTDVTMNETTIMHEAQASAKNKAQLKRTKKTIRVSRHGIQYSSLPAGVVKKLATTFLKTGGSNANIRKDTLATIMQASDWFFEQVSDDLGAYAEHAGRKTIDENDVITLMKRQRQTNTITTPFALAQRHLPRELLQDFRMVPPAKLRRGRERVEEE